MRERRLTAEYDPRTARAINARATNTTRKAVVDLASAPSSPRRQGVSAL